MSPRKPVTDHDFRHNLLDELERHSRIDGDKLNNAHLALGKFFRADNFAGAVEYATKELGIDIEKVRKAWNGW